MALLTIILLVFGFVVLVGLGITALVIYFKEPKQIEDSPRLYNFMSYKTNGHWEGVIRNIERGPGGRWKIIFEPKDVKPNDIIKKNWKLQKVVFDYNKFELIPIGDLSNHKNIAIGYPVKPEHIPSHLRQTSLGKMIIIMTEMKNYEKVVEHALRSGHDRKDVYIGEIGHGEISVEMMSRIKGLLLEDLKESIIKSRDKSISSVGFGLGRTGT